MWLYNYIYTYSYNIIIVTRKWHSESAHPAKALGPSDILDRNPVVDISDR